MSDGRWVMATEAPSVSYSRLFSAGTQALDKVFQGSAPALLPRPRCGWLGAEGTECPVDGSRLVEHDDITEVAVEAAATQAAEVIFVEHHPDLQAYGGIASIDRF